MSTGWSNDKLALSVEKSPLEKDRHADDQSRWCRLPQRLHTPTPDVLAGQRLESPASTAAWTRTSRRIPGGPSATRSGSMRLRRSQACDPRLGGSPKQRRFDTLTRYTKRTPNRRFRRSEALSSTWWQVEDSNLRSFRDGFTDHGRQAPDQSKRPFPNNFRAHSPQTTAHHRRRPDTAPPNNDPRQSPPK